MKSRVLFMVSSALITVSSRGAPGDVDPGFTADTNGSVRMTAVQTDGKILIGGVFTAANGVTRNRIARLNADGSLDTAFNPNAGGLAGADPLLTATILPDGKVILGGEFNSIGGVTRNSLARFNPDDTLDPGYNPNVTGPNDVWFVSWEPDGKSVITGQFTSVNGTTRNRIALLNPDGTLNSTFNPNANNWVATAARQADGKLLLAGGFTRLGGVTRNYIARLNANGTLDTSFNPNANESCRAFGMQSDGKFVVGGLFTTLGGVPREHLARLDANGTVDPAFHPAPNDEIIAIVVQCDGKILIGGRFTAVGGVTRNGIARILPDGTLDSSFNPNANGTVYSAAIQPDGKIVFGGFFTMVGGVARTNIARLDNDPATQSLTVTSATRVQWLRSGASQETHRVTFELYGGDNNWTLLGPGTRIAGGWEVTGLNLPVSGQVRARARVESGRGNGSSTLTETVAAFDLGTPLQTWRERHFGTTVNSGPAHNNADPDGDGLENLIEFAFGLNPNKAGTTAMPAWLRSDDDYVLTFTQPADVSRITYIAEYSTSLTPAGWTAIPNSGAPPSHAYYAPAGIAQRLFLRLRVTVP